MLLKILIGMVIAVSGLAAFIYANQERLIFHPHTLATDHRFRFPVPFEEVFVQSGDVQIHTLLFPKNDSEGVVLYFHGNAGALDSWGGLYADFEDLPYDLWIMDYRGFGKSGGRLSGEADLQADARAFYAAAMARFPGKPVVIYGRSIGTGVASWLATQHTPKRLILETPYFNFPDLAGQLAPWAPAALLRYGLMNNEHIRDQPFPVHLIHGDADGLIDVSHSTRLAAIGAHIELHVIRGGGHNNLSAFPRFHEVLRSILN